jgi:hypothetical protein
VTRRVRALPRAFAALLVGTTCVLAACTCEQAYAPSPADAPKTANAEAKSDAPQADAAKADAPAVPPLSEEDVRLIAADPKTLSPEDVRKRAFALRRKIMQNPDSPAARALEDLRRATEAGELQAPGAGAVRFEARGKDGEPPKGTMPPAGVRDGDAKPPSAP